jgi:hypothetical protein
MRVVGSQIFGHDLKHKGVSSGSNFGHQSTNGRLTATSTRDGGGATTATLVRRPGGYSEPFLMRSSPTRARAGWQTHLRGSWAAAATEAVRATGCPSSSSSATVRASSGGAPPRPRPPAASPWSPQIGARQRRLGQRWRLSLGPKYTRYRALFIGIFG